MCISTHKLVVLAVTSLSDIFPMSQSQGNDKQVSLSEDDVNKEFQKKKKKKIKLKVLDAVYGFKARREKSRNAGRCTRQIKGKYSSLSQQFGSQVSIPWQNVKNILFCFFFFWGGWGAITEDLTGNRAVDNSLSIGITIYT